MLLVAPFWLRRTWFPLLHRLCRSYRRLDLASQSSTPPTGLSAAGGPEPLLSSCVDPIRHTILNARAPSTRLQ